jgi:mRNA interferase HigB
LNVISKHGLVKLLKGKSKDVQSEVFAWYRIARKTDWASLADVRKHFPDADLVGELLVFNIRQNRYRLIVLPVFLRARLYVKALLNHDEYDREVWKTKWP